MEYNDKFKRLTYSYWGLRNTVGWIGTLLPFVLLAGVALNGSGPVIQISISHYYYSNMGDVFVGALCAISLFMFFYSGFDNWDNWAGNIAGMFALGVALFPTSYGGVDDLSGILHYISATGLFLTLAFFSLFLFRKTNKDAKATPKKLKRNIIYFVCGIIMVLCLAAIFVYYKFFEDINSAAGFVFWAETTALLAFGISWLTKGETIYSEN